MLQKLNFDDQMNDEDRGHLLRAGFYWQLLKRRAWFFTVPFVLIAAAGIAFAYLLPATYLSEGKVLVQSQQIPSELVRATVTNAAQERIQVIQQRTMSRENLLAIIDKFQLFPDKKDLMSATQLVELMRKNAKIEPIEQPLAFSRLSSRMDNPTIVFTVGFEYSDPQKATAVANELMTRILNEDLRDRTSRATDTTKFLTREVQKLQADNAAIELKIAQAKANLSRPSGTNGADQTFNQLAQLKAEYAQKSALYNERHPVMQGLRRQVEAMEKLVIPPAPRADAPVALEPLLAQQASMQKDLEAATSKLLAARIGETLERDQQAEKLEIIEQPTVPQDPISPNRRKIATLALMLAFAAGSGLTLLAEYADQSIRRSTDIFPIIDRQLVVSIPYITTKAEDRQKNRQIVFSILVGLVLFSGALAASYAFLPPLDLMFAKARVGLFR